MSVVANGKSTILPLVWKWTKNHFASLFVFSTPIYDHNNQWPSSSCYFYNMVSIPAFFVNDKCDVITHQFHWCQALSGDLLFVVVPNRINNDHCVFPECGVVQYFQLKPNLHYGTVIYIVRTLQCNNTPTMGSKTWFGSHLYGSTLI
jgi:hypothetical protein